MEERKIHGHRWIFVEGCSTSKCVTIVLSGNTGEAVASLERTIEKGLSVLKSVVEEGSLVEEAQQR